MPKPIAPLTDKQARFVAEYLVDLSATQAAIRAGYSARSATKQGFENLQKPEIRRAINASKRRVAAKLEISAERVLQRLSDLSKKAEKAGQFNAAVTAETRIGQHLKLFTEKHEHGGIGGGPVQFQITESEADH